MVTLREVGNALTGAWRLARLDPGGLAHFDGTPAGALRSFYAALLALPLHAIMQALSLWPAEPVPLGRLIVVELLAYVIAWTAFPVAMIEISRWLDRAERYPLYLTAYNWANFLTTLVYFPIVLIAGSGLAPRGFVELLALVFTVGVLIYAWFVARTTLEIGGGVAAGLVATDFTLTILIVEIADALLAG